MKIKNIEFLGKHIQPLSNITVLIISTICMVLFGMCNPYGIKGNIYLFQSMHIVSDSEMINELKKPELCSFSTAVFLFLVIVGIVGITKMWKKNQLNMYHVLLWFGGNLTYLLAIRNLLLALVFSLPLVMKTVLSSKLVEKEWNVFEKLNEKVLWQILMAVLSVMIIFITIFNYQSAWHVKDTHMTPVEAVAYLNEHVADKDNTRVYTSFNNGAFLEWNGYKVYIDARPELYEKKEQKIYSEFLEIYKSHFDPEEFLNKYDFDYLIIFDDSNNQESLLRYYLKHESKYEMVIDGNGYEMYVYNK